MPYDTEHPTMRPAAEIAAWLAENNDFFAFSAEALVPFLPWEQARTYLKAEYTVFEWMQTWAGANPEPLPEQMLREMREYLHFAFDKALGHRGLSAGRSVYKLRAWAYALDMSDELIIFLGDQDRNYAPYGAPMLARIAEELGEEQPSGSEWTRMARGMRCTDDCEECGV